MPKMIAVKPGAELRIGNILVTAEVAVSIPEELAAEYANDSEVRIVLDVDPSYIAQRLGRKVKPAEPAEGKE